MLVGDLGFRAVFLLVGVIFPAIGFFIRRKWRLAVARREEIRRLLALASEEAARAELEASIEYAASSAAAVAPAPVVTKAASKRYCAVCYSPTSSRCRRCKSVFYCSSKCQVIHWRQGHNHECSPKPIDPDINDLGSKLNHESARQNDHYDYSDANSTDMECRDESNSASDAQSLPGKNGTKSYDDPDGSKLTQESARQNDRDDYSDTNSTEVECRDKSNSVGEAQSLPGKNGTKSYDDPDGNIQASESSWVSASSADHKLSDDDSLSEDEILHDLETSGDAEKLEQAKSLPSASMLEIDEKASQITSKNEECQCISSSASDSDENTGPKPSAVSSGFWDGVLENDSIRTTSDEVVSKCSSDSNSVSRFPLDSPGHSSSDLHSDESELSYHTPALVPGTGNHIQEAILSGKNPMNSSRSSNSSISADKGGKKVSSSMEPEEAKHSPPRTSFDHSAIVGDHSVGASPLVDHESSSYNSGGPKGGALSATKEYLVPEKVGTPQNAFVRPLSSNINRRSASPFVPEPAKSGEDKRGGAHIQPSAVLGSATDSLKISTLKVDKPRSLKLSRYYSFGGGGSGVSAKSSEKGLFAYELFVKLYNWKKVELRPCGLINCGNSCYANVVLQCLTFTPPLTAYLLQGLHSKKCAKKGWCFTCEFERLILMEKDRNSPLSPISILSQIEKIGSHLANGREEDAHEFLRYVIDTMQSICLQEAGVSGPFKPLEEETNLMGLTFGGYLRSKIRCTRCLGKSERHERMMDLTVEIEGDIETLEEALKKFTGTESLDGENKYHCSRCGSYEKAKKKLTILEAPNVLTIALKRFQSGKFGKLNKSIRFPEILDLAPYMGGGSDKLPIYQLYGVVVHLDIMNATFSGHYVCYIRNAQNKWFKIDDSIVKAVEKESVLNKGAYMLFYSRCSPRAPRSIRSSLVPSVSTKEKDFEDKSTHNLKPGAGKPWHTKPGTGSFSGATGSQDPDSTSETSSIFSQSEEGASTSDSNQGSSASTDDFPDHLFSEGAYAPYAPYSQCRNSSDSDTSSSSSPSYATRRSPLSNSKRYASCHSSLGGFDGDSTSSFLRG